MRLVVNEAAVARGLPAPWPVPLALKDAAERVNKRIKDLGGLSGWGVEDLGTLRELLLPAAEREKAGVWYTPSPVADFITTAALGTLPPLNLYGPPETALATAVIDPACGAGVFLLAAARRLAYRYAGLLCGGQHPPAHLVDEVLPEVMRRCMFGIDIDPVAVDLAKAACWLVTGGAAQIDWLDDNIIVGDALAGDLPPALARHTGPLAVVGNPPYREKARGAAPWIEARRPGPGQPRTADELWRPSLDEFRVAGQGRIEYSLNSLYVYFWRWAMWQAFETRLTPSVVALLTPAGYLVSQALAGMRARLREAADVGFVIDLTPEGMQSPIKTRIFPGVQQELAIGIFARTGPPRPEQPAWVRHREVTGSRDDKIRNLHALLKPASADPAEDADMLTALGGEAA